MQPDGWEERSIKDLIKDGLFVDGDWVESKDQDPDGDVRLIQLADIGDGAFLDKSSRYLTNEKAQELKCTHLKPKDILVARMPEPLGRACFFPKLSRECVTVVDVAILRPKENLDRRWLLQYINAPFFRNEISSKATGTTRKRISRSNLASLKLSVPAIDEQRKIADVLQSVDDAITATQDVIDQTRKVKQGLLHRLLTRGIGHTTFKQTDIGEIPKSWDFVTLKDIAFDGDGLQTGPFGSQLHASEYSEEGIAVVMPKDIHHERAQLHNAAKVPEEVRDRLGKHIVEVGDILFARRGDIGRCGLITDREAGSLCGTGCLRARPNQKLVHPTYLIKYLHLETIRKWLEENAVGQTMLNLNTSILSGIPIALPPLDEQEKIGNIIQSVDDNIQESLRKLEQLQALKTGVMSDLLSGRVRVPLDNPMKEEAA